MKAQPGGIPFLSPILKYWPAFHRFAGNRLLPYIGASFLVTLADGLGITMFFPLFSYLSGARTTDQHSRGFRAVEWVFSSVGLPMTLVTLLYALIFVFTVKGIFQLLVGAFQGRVVTYFSQAISTRIMMGYAGLDYRYYLNANIGTLSNIATNESYRATVSFIKYASIFPNLITIICYTAIAIAFDWQVTSFSVIFGVTLVFCLRKISILSRKYSYENTEALNSFSNIAVQSLGAFKYLRSTASFSPLSAHIKRTIQRVRDSQFKITILSAANVAVNEPATVVFLAFMLWYQVVHKGQGISEVIVLLLFYFRLMKELMAVQGNWQSFCATMGSIDQVLRTVEDTERHAEKYGSIQVHGIEQGIRFENVSFEYREGSPVLTDVSIQIPKNRMVALVGESGSGKSTLVDLMTGLLTPTSGRMTLDGKSYTELDLPQLRSKIGYVTQDGALFDDHVANNISLWSCDYKGDASCRKRVHDAAERANCARFVSEMPEQFETAIGDRGIKLSGGQKQRISIARELFKNPSLLILDEATSALDTETERDIQQSIDQLKGKTTVVLIAHRLSTIRNADYIYVMSKGRVIEEGSFEELSQRSKSQFRRLCELQSVVL